VIISSIRLEVQIESRPSATGVFEPALRADYALNRICLVSQASLWRGSHA